MRGWLSIALALGPALAASAGSRSPVVVELFTSEGCSSCPPADAVLSWLEFQQPIGNARVIALAEHVDYWNNLGWVDPFSSPQFRMRQNDYGIAFRVDSIYTPQMVVNGLVGFVGSDRDRARQEIEHAAEQPTATVHLEAAQDSKGAAIVDLGVQIGGLPKVTIPRKKGVAALDIYLAVTEDGVGSEVRRGENAGRRLSHNGLVRSFGVIGTMDPRKHADLVLHPTLKLPAAWNRQHLHAVVFLQEHDTRRIVGAESIGLN